MSPYYSRVTQFFKDRGVKCFLVDSDGNMLETMKLFLEAGVDGCIPCEIKAGTDPVVLRKMYPGIQLMGGIDKMALIEGRKEVDRELERVIPLLEEGGFIPSPDHLIPPTVSFDQYRYFVDRRHEMVKRYHP
jgi:uroporphyrinogen-III decarboxylase